MLDSYTSVFIIHVSVFIIHVSVFISGTIQNKGGE